MNKIKKVFLIGTIYGFALISTLAVGQENVQNSNNKYAGFEKQPADRPDLIQMAKDKFGQLGKKFGLELDLLDNKTTYGSKDSWAFQPFFFINKNIKWAEIPNPMRSIQDFWNNKIKQYKIHLMPKTEDIAQYLEKVFKLIHEDIELKDCIYAVKAVVAYPEEKYIKPKSPKIVIYVFGKNCAQAALDKIYEQFRKEVGTGTDEIPGFNEKVTNFIYFAQGNRDDKIGKVQDNLYEPGKVYYNANYIQKMTNGIDKSGKFTKVKLDSTDFHLVNPNNRK